MNASTDNGAWARSGASERSPSDLEREGEQIRADLDRTLDEIERKFSPGELLDRSVDFLRNNGGEFIREAGETVRNNPIPVILTAAGLIWLTTSIATRNRGSRLSSYDEGEELSSYRGSSDYGGSDYGEDYGEYGQEGEGLGGKVDEARSRVSNAAQRMSGRVAGKAQDVAGRVRDRAQGAHSDLMNLVQEQPIALGALALAAGALIGAALPITQYENRLVGPTRDRTMARAKELGEQQYENLKQAVSSSAERREGTNRSGESARGSVSAEAANLPPEQG